jgi:hypothetical protein
MLNGPVAALIGLLQKQIVHLKHSGWVEKLGTSLAFNSSKIRNDFYDLPNENL